MKRLLERGIIFVGGKGGVGKTTTAGALALAAAETERRVLVVSTDPAHSLGDAFDTTIGDREVPLAEHLWGLEIDPDAEAERHIATVKQSMKELMAPRMYGEIDRQLELSRHSPGAVEAALLERVAGLMSDARSRFDLVIFDTAPTGHTLRLLSLPEILAAWTGGMLRHQDRSNRLGELLKSFSKQKPRQDELGILGRVAENTEQNTEDSRTSRIDEILLSRRRKFHRARDLLTDKSFTAFLLVLTPERLPILESRRALDVLDRFDVPVAAIVVNRLLPDDVDGDFFRKRRLQQEAYREEIDREFASLPRLYLPLLPHDVHGIDTLRQIGEMLINQVMKN